MNDEPLVRDTPNPEAGWQYITTIINGEELNIDFSIPEEASRIMKAEKQKAAERLRRAQMKINKVFCLFEQSGTFKGNRNRMHR